MCDRRFFSINLLALLAHKYKYWHRRRCNSNYVWPAVFVQENGWTRRSQHHTRLPGWLEQKYKYWHSCWYKSTNTDAGKRLPGGAKVHGERRGTQVYCFASTKVQILAKCKYWHLRNCSAPHPNRALCQIMQLWWALLYRAVRCLEQIYLERIYRAALPNIALYSSKQRSAL